MKFFSSAMIAGLLVCAVQNAHAAFNINGGNALWGKYAIQTCRSCHSEMGLTSLDPKERSAEQWELFFVDDYKKLREMSHDFGAVGINDRQLENIHRYLADTARSGDAAAAATAEAVQRTTSGKKISSSSSRSQSVAKSKTSSGSKKFDMSAGSDRKGRYIFRKCLACHKKSGAPIISPGDRTRKAWSRFFEQDFRKFKRYMPKFDTYKYSVGQMEDLHQFFLKYALDSEKPKTCE